MRKREFKTRRLSSSLRLCAFAGENQFTQRRTGAKEEKEFRSLSLFLKSNQSLKLITLLLLLSLLCAPATLHAQMSVAAVPIVDMDGGCLMGGAVGGQWVKAEEFVKRMSGGDKYRLYDLKGLWKTVTGGKAASQGAPCEDTLYVELPKDFLGSQPEGSHYIGVAGEWNPAPRSAKIESNGTAVYRSAVAEILKRKGIRNPQVNLVKVVRVDLEGDGVDEVIINATRVNRFENGSITPDPRAGDYSLVMLRKVINGHVQTIMLDEEYHVKAAKFTAPNEYDLIAVLDLNGDGIMEIVTAGGYYEGDWKTVYSIKGNKAVDVLGCGCGA